MQGFKTAFLTAPVLQYPRLTKLFAGFVAFLLLFFVIILIALTKLVKDIINTGSSIVVYIMLT